MIERKLLNVGVQGEMLMLVGEERAQPFHNKIVINNQFATNFSM